MKKLMALLVLLSLTMFTIGCSEPETPAPTPPAVTPPADTPADPPADPPADAPAP